MKNMFALHTRGCGCEGQRVKNMFALHTRGCGCEGQRVKNMKIPQQTFAFIFTGGLASHHMLRESVALHLVTGSNHSHWP